MKKQFFSLAFLVFFTLAARAEMVPIDNAELVRLAASGVTVIDVRSAKEWKESGVIPGSRLLTFIDENGRSDPPQWLQKVRTISKPQQPVVLVCRSSKRSAAAAQFLAEQAGYKTVYNVNKGLNGWAGEGRAVVPPAASMLVQ